MLLYSSMRELTRELSSGSVVLVPSELLATMSKYLNLELLGRKGTPKLCRAPFYVIEVPTVYTTIEKSRLGFKIEGEISPEANILNKVKAKLASLKTIALLERGEMKAVHPAMADEHYIQEVTHMVELFVDEYRERVAGRPILLYVNKPDPQAVDLLSRVRPGYSVATYIALPINLLDFDKSLVKLVRDLIRNNRHVTLLLGIEPREVLLEYRKDVVVRKPLTRYLIQSIVESALPTDDKEGYERSHMISNIVASIMDCLFDEDRFAKKVDSPEWKFSINTVFLDTLKSLVASTFVMSIEEQPTVSSSTLGAQLYEFASINAKSRINILTLYMRSIGVLEDVVKAVRYAKWVLRSDIFADVRQTVYAMMKKKKKYL